MIANVIVIECYYMMNVGAFKKSNKKPNMPEYVNRFSTWRRSIVVRTLVSAGELSLSCARLLAG